MIGVLKCTGAEAFFACGSRHVQLKKAPPITGPKRPAVYLSKDGKLMGGVVVSSGIYQIRNQISGSRYIGSAVRLRKRWWNHLSALRCGQHRNAHLQAAFRKYGQSAFEFSILERAEPHKLILREQHYLDTLKPEYNLAPTAGSSLGLSHSSETRNKISQALMGQHHSDAARRKMSRAKMGHSVSQDTRRKISEAMSGERNHNYGKPLSEEHCGKISAWWTPERRQALSDRLRGRRLSKETRAKMSKAQRAYWHRIDTAKKQEEANGYSKV